MSNTTILRYDSFVYDVEGLYDDLFDLRTNVYSRAVSDSRHTFLFVIHYRVKGDGLNTRRKLTYRVQRPVGQKVELGPGQSSEPHFQGYRSYWLDSGTSALALALQFARNKKPHLRDPLVVLPAYGCPDLVAAAIFAGVKPLFIDIGSHDPALDLVTLSRLWNENIVAVVAVNFLGIRERIAELRTLCHKGGALLIEDCAQWYPETLSNDFTNADAVILSFGRGKPVNLMGGGGLLLRETLSPLCSEQKRTSSKQVAMTFRVKAALYNMLADPFFYALIVQLPGMRLGETRYHPLEEILSMDPCRLSYLSRNILKWTSQDRWREDYLSQKLARLKGVTVLSESLRNRSGRLLRFPILLPNSAAATQTVNQATRLGLGASNLYGSALMNVANMPAMQTCHAHENADDFANRLVTLPVHSGVNRTELDRLTCIVRNCSGDSL